MVILVPLVLFFQWAWRSELTLWGGSLFLVEILFLSAYYRGQWRQAVAWMSVFLLSFIFRPFSWEETMLLLVIAVVGRVATERWITAESYLAQWWLLVIGTFAYMSLVYGLELRALPPQFLGSMLLACLVMVPFLFVRKSRRGLL